ncbi:putative G-protein coupled receptor 132b [Pholidichthys leucotaenia]
MLAVSEEVTMTTNHSAPVCVPPYDDSRVPLVLLYSGVLAVGLPTNLLTAFLTVQQVWRKNVLGVYLFALTLCDLGYLCTLPLWVIYVSGSHTWPWSSAACKLTGYIFFNNMYVSIFLLCCISFDRYVAVVYSLEARGLRRQRLATLVVLAVFLVVAVGHVPVFTMREGATSNGSRHCFEPSWGSAMVTGFNYARFVIGFLLPLLLLVVTNRCILANVQRSTGLRCGQKRRVQRLAVAVVALFLVCFGPYHLILLIRAIVFHFPRLEGSCQFKSSTYTPYTVSLGLSTINSAANPLLYVLSSNNIRKELRQGLAQVCGWALLRLESGSNHNYIEPTDKSIDLDQDVGRPNGGEPSET